MREYTELYLWDTGSVFKGRRYYWATFMLYTRVSLGDIFKYIRIFKSDKLVAFKIWIEDRKEQSSTNVAY